MSSVASSSSLSAAASASSSSYTSTSSSVPGVTRAYTAPKGKSLWKENGEPSDIILQLATETSVTAKGADIAGCMTCRELVVVKLDDRALARCSRHACSGDPEALSDGDGRKGCWSESVYFASLVYQYPAIRDQVRDIEAHSLADVLQRIERDQGVVGRYAALVPPGFVAKADDPPVLVARDSSAAWIALNAVALANSLTPGHHATVENSRKLLRSGAKAMKTAIDRARDKGSRSIVVPKCEHHECEYAIFNGKAGGNARDHTCRRPRAPDERLPRIRTVGSWASVFELPAHVWVAMLAWLKETDDPRKEAKASANKKSKDRASGER